MNNRYFRNIALTGVVGLALAVCVVIRTMAPMAVLPKLDIPNMVLLSLAALVLGHYCKAETRISVPAVIFAGLTFAILPLAAGFAAGMEAVKLGVVGCVVYAVTALLFDSIQDRLSSGPVAKAAPLFSAVGLYLAAQCFSGMWL